MYGLVLEISCVLFVIEDKLGIIVKHSKCNFIAMTTHKKYLHRANAREGLN